MSNPAQKYPPFCRTRKMARRGFTLIEMLVVIGIILLLIGISVAGFAQLAKHAKGQHTRAALAAVSSMLGEFEATAGKQGIAGFKAAWDSPVMTPIDASAAPPVITLNPFPPIEWEYYSGQVLAKLLELPNNKAILDKLPTEQVRKVQLPLAGAPWPVNTGHDFYEILDGYGHPLQFVPSIGVGKVITAGSATPGIIQSDGRLHLAPDTYPNPNPRYFWMSFGADGRADLGDDNAYSFDQ